MLCFQKNTHPPTLIYNRKCWDTFAARNERVYIVPGREASGTNKYYFEAERVRHPVSHTLFNLFERRRWARKAKSKATAGSLISLLLDKREYCWHGCDAVGQNWSWKCVAAQNLHLNISRLLLSKITRPFILFYGQNSKFLRAICLYLILLKLIFVQHSLRRGRRDPTGPTSLTPAT